MAKQAKQRLVSHQDLCARPPDDLPMLTMELRQVALLACIAALVLLGGCRSARFPQYPSNYREYAYVADAGGREVAVLDLVNVREQTTLTVAPRPVALAASRLRNEVYVVSQGLPGQRGSLALLDAETNRVAATLPLGRMPSALALSPDDTRVYVANQESNNISVVDVAARRVIGIVGAGEAPDALAVAPDNRTLVVANRTSGSVSLLDLDRGKNLPQLRASFSGCPGASSVVILPNSTQAFIACAAGHQVMTLGLRTLADAHRHTAAEPDRLLTMLDVGQQPVALAIKPDGGEVFAMDAESNTVSEIATGTDEVGGAYLIGAEPVAAVVSADNSLLWVANEGADTVAVYSTEDGKLINTVHVGGGPDALTLSADGHLLLAADGRSGDVSVIRTWSRNLRREPVQGTLFTLLPAGSHPVAIADKAFRLPH